MNLKKETALIEAILFLETDTVSLLKIIKITKFSKDMTLEILEQLKNTYMHEDRGIELLEISDGYQLVPKKELWDFLKEYYGKKNDDKLSRAALETLSIIAYSQPITRVEIENIRGVSPDGMIRLLLQKGLIKEVGKKDVPGKPLLYGTTKNFLKLFNLRSISDLPKLDEIEKERFELNG